SVFGLQGLDAVEHALQIGRQRRLEFHRSTISRMREDEPMRVEEWPVQRENRTQVRSDARAPAPVRRVADDGVADGAEVNADLMRGPGLDRDLAQRAASIVMRARDARHGVPRAG